LLAETVVEGLDEDLVQYVAGMLCSKVAEDEGSPTSVTESVEEVLLPFLESVHCPEHLVKASEETVLDVLQRQADQTAAGAADSSSRTTRKLQQGMVSMSSDLLQSDEQDLAESRMLWGTDQGVRPMANELIEAHPDKLSAKERRKMRKVEAERARKLLSSATDQDADVDEAGGGLVRMNVRKGHKLSAGTDKTRDVQVRNVTLSLDNGAVLLEAGEIKFAYQRRYGLIGENGVGKSTLLRAMAQEDGIEGFPSHLRVLHVRQEVPAHLSTSLTVTEAVLKSDLERNMLLERERELLARLDKAGGEDGHEAELSIQQKREKLSQNAADLKTMEGDLKELDELYARLQVLSADSAEARAAMILSGLQFSPAMQSQPISSLSGGWRMRVALAAALFIEPDILML
jgi:ATP-binding cassette subfamily F protein 3